MLYKPWWLGGELDELRRGRALLGSVYQLVRLAIPGVEGSMTDDAYRCLRFLVQLLEADLERAAGLVDVVFCLRSPLEFGGEVRRVEFESHDYFSFG